MDDYREDMRKAASDFLRIRKALVNNRNSARAFTSILLVVLTRSWRLTAKKDTFRYLTGRTRWSLNYVRSREGKKNLKRVNAADSVGTLVRQLKRTSVREWLQERYEYARDEEPDPNLDEIKGVAEKGRDHILRDVGYLDRAPIDFHEKNFMIRTGIFHLFGARQADIRNYNHYHNALTRFCADTLKGIYIQGKGIRINLATSPGLFDSAVWSHCAAGGENICGRSPRCFSDKTLCPLFGTCLWSLKLS